MELFGIDFDRATAANVGALFILLAYIVFIGYGITIPEAFHDVVKVVVGFLFLSKAYEYNNGNTPQ